MARANALSFAIVALSVLAGVPSAAVADRIDDLDATMEVLDDPVDLESTLSKLRSPDDQEAEIGYSISPGFQRRGLGQETVEALVAHLFNKKGIVRIIAKTDPDNIASNKLLEKLGFSKTAHLKKSVEIRGELKDDLIFELEK